MIHFLRRLPFTVPFLKPSNGPVNPLISQSRGIRVDVRDDNLEQALALMQRKMQRSGMERLIKRHADLGQRHVKKSEKRVLARKSLQMRIRSQELARRLQTILVKKIRNSGEEEFELSMFKDLPPQV